MWVKLTPEEIARGARKRRRSRILQAAEVGLLCALILTFLPSGYEGLRGKEIPVPMREVPDRVVPAILFGVIIGWLEYGFKREKPTVICPKCGAVGYEGDSLQCQCGGHLERMDEMRWI